MKRLYICAAAGDMASERELLHTYVLPELNDRLAEHGIEVAADDPRASDDYAALSAAERVTEALDRIDRARPWFVALVGDAVDDAPTALPADVLARQPWLSEYQGASVLELELAYGVLEGPSERKALVYLRDDRFLRDVPFDQRGQYSSEDLVAVGRLETLKAQLREAGVHLVDGYHCRWDDAAGRVNDLDELGKQLVEDLYEAILQAEHPEMEIGVLDELPASGAAMGMVSQTSEGPPRGGSPGNSDDDDLNFDMEDILDVDAGLKDSSSASAIEGVEPLDFLDDDAPPAAPPRALEPTINYDASQHDADAEFDVADEILAGDEQFDEIISLDDIELGEGEQAEALDDLSDMVDDAQPIVDESEEAPLWADEDDASVALVGPVDDFVEPPPTSASPGFESTMAWSQASAASPEPSEADEFAASLEEELEIDIVDGGMFADEAPLAQPVADDGGDAPLAAWASPQEAAVPDEQERAASEAAATDEFAAFLEEPVAEHVPEASPAPTGDEDAGWNFDDEAAESPAGGVFADERTIRHTSEATEISDVGDDELPVATPEEEDEFRLQPEPEPATPAAPVVASSYAPSPMRKKKSSLPLILTVLVVLLLVGGGAGAYFAGLIPGLGGGNNVAENTTPANDAGAAFAALINENNSKLTELFRNAKSPTGQIDGAKVAEGQALIAGLEANQPDVAAEEQIQSMKSRFAQLAVDFEKQQVASAQTKRQEDFRKALELAGASAPMSLDASFLDEANLLAANDDERNLIVALEQQVADYAAEQARLAAENSGKAKTEALAAIAAATGDAEDYRAAIDAFAAAYPDDVATTDFKLAQETEPATLDAVAALNKLAADWAKLDMRKLTAAEAQQQLDAASAVLERTAALPGGAEISQRAEALKPIAARTAAPQLAGSAIQAPFVLGMQDGQRYYMTGKPTSKDGKLVATYVSDLAETGATAEAEIVPAEIDKPNSGTSTLPATAKAVNDALATANAAWESAFIKALMAVEADAKMDPVVKTHWLLVLATQGSAGSQPLALALGDFAKLSETGVDANFNWADPAAAAALREKCAAAIAALPQVRSLLPAVGKALGELASLSVPAPATPVGVLAKDAEDAWTVALTEGAPPAASLVVVIAPAADAPLGSTSIGTIEAGEAVLDGAADTAGWTQGRVVYALTSAEAPAETN